MKLARITIIKYTSYNIQGSADEEALEEEAAGLEEALPTRRKVEVPSNQRLFASSTRRAASPPDLPAAPAPDSGLAISRPCAQSEVTNTV